MNHSWLLTNHFYKIAIKLLDIGRIQKYPGKDLIEQTFMCKEVVLKCRWRICWAPRRQAECYFYPDAVTVDILLESFGCTGNVTVPSVWTQVDGIYRVIANYFLKVS